MSLGSRFGELGTPLKVVVVGVVAVGSLFALVVGGAVVGSFALDLGTTSGASDVPEGQFSAGTDAGQMTITMEDGEAFGVTDLLVVVDGDARTWESLADDGEFVVPGDAVTVEASAGTSVELVYDGGDEPTTLAVFTA